LSGKAGGAFPVASSTMLFANKFRSVGRFGLCSILLKSRYEPEPANDPENYYDDVDYVSVALCELVVFGLSHERLLSSLSTAPPVF